MGFWQRGGKTRKFYNLVPRISQRDQILPKNKTSAGSGCLPSSPSRGLSARCPPDDRQNGSTFCRSPCPGRKGAGLSGTDTTVCQALPDRKGTKPFAAAEVKRFRPESCRPSTPIPAPIGYLPLFYWDPRDTPIAEFPSGAVVLSLHPAALQRGRHPAEPLLDRKVHRFSPCGKVFS